MIWFNANWVFIVW